MKLRAILLLLALMAFLFAAIGGFLHISDMKTSALKEAKRQVLTGTLGIKSRITALLSENIRAVKILGGLEETKQALRHKDERSLEEVDYVLDQFRDSLEASVCYLMDENGTTLASTNRNTETSFVNKNYSFRPYFQQAIHGIPAIYMALGVTSKKRGIYYSHAVTEKGRPIGVVVIKASIEPLEMELSESYTGTWILSDPNGVIFASNRKDWLFKLLWKAYSEQKQEIMRSRQFGNGPWDWIGLKRKGHNLAIDPKGHEYWIQKAAIQMYPGWMVYYLADLDEIKTALSKPFIKTTGNIFLAFCLLVGSAVFFLYRKASDEIHKRQDVEEALQESENILRTVINATNEAIIAIDEKGSITLFNPAAEEMFKQRREGMIGKSLNDLMPPEYRKRHQEYVRSYFTEGTPRKAIGRILELPGQRSDGSMFPMEISLSSARFGNKHFVIAVARDVTERKKAEETLRNSEERYRSISEIISDFAYGFRVEPDNNIVNEWVIGALERITGFSIEDLQKRGGWENLIHPDDISIPRKQLEVLLSGKPDIGEYRIVAKDGKVLWMRNYARPVWDEELGRVTYIYGAVQDITQRKLAEDEKRILETKLQRAKKMEAIGMLAGGVAHDLNNILAGLVGYPELLLMEQPEDSPLRKPLMTIQKSGEKAASIVQDLLTLARRGVEAEEIVNLNTIINEYLKSPEYRKMRTFYPYVQVEVDLDQELMNITGSHIQLSKTVTNLVSNAFEAMPQKGKICVETENRYIDRSIRGYDDVEEGDYVILSITDTGVGISQEDIERIFEPFYTKKVMGRSGTGLGMAVVWGTIKDHRGYIDVDSTEGKQTTFRLFIPATRRQMDRDSRFNTTEDYSGKGETILIIDDVEEQRLVAGEMLRRLGYAVASVTSGEEAVDYMKSNQADLLVLDMIMDPGIDGLDTYKRILQAHPGQKAIIVSGFSETDRVKEAQNLGAGAYIKKPYLLEKIGIAVRSELDR